MKKLFITSVCLICLIGIVSCNKSDNDNIETPTNEESSQYTSSQDIQNTEHTHSYDSTVVAPTCTENGFTLHACSLCDEQYSDSTVQALGHNYEKSFQDAPCNQYQKNIFTCSACADSYEETLDVKGTIHSYVPIVTYPTRESGGYTTHSCENCTISYVDSYTDPVNFSVGLDYTKESGKYYVSGLGTCSDLDIIIPSTSEQGFKVAGIMGNAFANSNVTSITVSDGVSSIRSQAFYDCHSLRSVTLPKSASLSDDLFFRNPQLTSLTMPMQKPLAYYFRYANPTPDGYKLLEQGDGSVSGTHYGVVPYSLREINILSAPCASALSQCDMLTKVSIASDATSIGAGAFRGCSALTEISIPDGVRTIGAYAFAGTAISSVTIPKNVSFSINDHGIFEDCSSLSEVEFLSQSTILPSSMFANCVSLDSLEIPNSVTSLGASFISGTSIERLAVPTGVTDIAMHTFNGCNKLKEVVLPQGLKNIEYGAFKGCIALEQIEFPTGLEKIGHEAFMDCGSLKKALLPTNLKTLDHSAFKNCTALEQVILPSSLQVIPAQLFFGCSNLSELTLPSTVTTIKESAFEGCGITSIVIPEAVTRIGPRTFAGCPSLRSVTFSSDSAPLSNEMFLGATALESITIPKNITHIPFRFCKDATALNSIVFPEGLLVVNDNAFSGCTNLKALTLPQALRTVGNQAFMGCTSLERVDFSNASISSWNATWDYESFADCTALTEVVNHNNVEYLNASVFKNTPLQTVENGMTVALGWLLAADPQVIPTVLTIPQGVTKIRDYAFSACKNLTEVTIPEGVVYLGIRIFGESSGATALTKLVLPDSLTSFSTDTISFLPEIDVLVVGKGLRQIQGNRFGNLTTLQFRGTVAEFGQMPWCEHNAIKSITVICTDGTIEPTVTE